MKNVANAITVSRVVLTFGWLGLATQYTPGLFDEFSVIALVSACVFVALALSDNVDGFIARHTHTVSTFGKYMDPIADKLLVFAALLILYSWGWVSVWVLFIILFREFIVSGLRMLAGTRKIVIAANLWGKLKTLTTNVSISFLLFAAAGLGASLGSILYLIGEVLIYIAVVLTVISGVIYCYRFLKAQNA